MFLKKDRGRDLAVAIVIGVLAFLILSATDAYSATVPKPLPKLVYNADVAYGKASGLDKKFKITGVVCKTTTAIRVYVCQTSAIVRKTGAKRCAETYIHYNPALSKTPDFFNEAWACNSRRKPKVLAYPGEPDFNDAPPA